MDVPLEPDRCQHGVKVPLCLLRVELGNLVFCPKLRQCLERSTMKSQGVVILLWTEDNSDSVLFWNTTINGNPFLYGKCQGQCKVRKYFVIMAKQVSHFPGLFSKISASFQIVNFVFAAEILFMVYWDTRDTLTVILIIIYYYLKAVISLSFFSFIYFMLFNNDDPVTILLD